MQYMQLNKQNMLIVPYIKTFGISLCLLQTLFHKMFFYIASRAERHSEKKKIAKIFDEFLNGLNLLAEVVILLH